MGDVISSVDFAARRNAQAETGGRTRRRRCGIIIFPGVRMERHGRSERCEVQTSQQAGAGDPMRRPPA